PLLLLLDAREDPVESPGRDRRPAERAVPDRVDLQGRCAVGAAVLDGMASTALDAAATLEGPVLGEGPDALRAEDDLPAAFGHLVVGAACRHAHGDAVQRRAVDDADDAAVIEPQLVETVDLVQLDELAHLTRPPDVEPGAHEGAAGLQVTRLPGGLQACE